MRKIMDGTPDRNATDEKISMELPEVNILEFNMAQNKIGDAEEIVGAVLVEMSGELSGLMMLILKSYT